MTTTILWFRNDLRVHDHPALTAASLSDNILPIFIFDPQILQGRHASSNRNRFLLESLEDLKYSLQKLGADLVIRTGQPLDVLNELIIQTGAQTVVATEDFSPLAVTRDSKVYANLSVPFELHPGRLAVDSLDEIVNGSGDAYRVFTPFWKKWAGIRRRELSIVPDQLILPSGIVVGELPTLENLTNNAEFSPNPRKGGETAARQHLDVWLISGINEYHLTHDLVGSDATSRLSAYLHFGCLSVREIETMLPDGEGAAAWHRQLAWRDFYHYILKHFPSNAHQAFQERYRDMAWNEDDTSLEAWKQGRTGYPIVDAAMRQLLAEGWMHNRSRLIVGSFLTKDLGLDWKAGERHFMRWLIDGDEANNNGNWQWIASVGVDPAPVFRRLYNPKLQQERYDPDGSYVRKFVPELISVPDKYLSDPSRMTSGIQAEAGCIIGQDYPHPIVDHAIAREQALARYRQP
jgi:deoxyribodipyrimidine photo-lyase